MIFIVEGDEYLEMCEDWMTAMKYLEECRELTTGCELRSEAGV